LETSYFRYDHNKRQPEKINRLLYDEIICTCRYQRLEPVIAFVTSDDYSKQMKAHFEEMNVRCLDFSFDLSSPVYSLLPYDTHPNGYTNTLFANRAKAMVDTFFTR
jgi:hypothetical protein